MPTLDESGFKGFEAIAWAGLTAPAKTPAAIVSRLHKEFSDILKLPDITAKHIEVGAQLVGGTPEQFRAYLGTELVKFGKLVKAAGIQPE